MTHHQLPAGDPARGEGVVLQTRGSQVPHLQTRSLTIFLQELIILHFGVRKFFNLLT